MQEVVDHSGDSPHGPASSLAFWAVTVVGLGLFALGVLATPYCRRQETRAQLAVEQNKTRQLQAMAEELQTRCDALTQDPKYLARQIREDLGYHRPGEQPLPLLGHVGGRPLPTSECPPPVETRLDAVCRLFSAPLVRHASLASGLLLLAIGVIWFEIPTTRTRSMRTGTTPT